MVNYWPEMVERKYPELLRFLLERRHL